jgi:membrane protein implicated in regulation of membrane protease activity
MTVAADLSWLIAGAGIVLGAATLLVFRRPALALHVLLDLLLAAGLLRLSADMAWSVIAVTATVVILRRVVTRSLLSADGGTPGLTRGGARVHWPVRR